MKTGYALWNLVGDKALSKPSVLLEAPAEGSDHGGSVAGWEGAGGCWRVLSLGASFSLLSPSRLISTAAQKLPMPTKSDLCIAVIFAIMAKKQWPDPSL